jgi:serine/threonine protein kinase
MTENNGPEIHPFSGNERFSLVRQLGSGGMGIVFEVEDRMRSSRVALKTLLRLNPTDLYRFKKEFRSLQRLVHPNLVTLYEFISDQGHWFFTMELVDGKDFLTYVRGPHGDDDGAEPNGSPVPGRPRSPAETVCLLVSSTCLADDPAGQPGTAATTPDETSPASADHPPLADTIADDAPLSTVDADDSNHSTEIDRQSDLATYPNGVEIAPPTTVAGSPAAGLLVTAAAAAVKGPACDLRRLRDVLEQIAGGLHYLHESGMLHRDLKPSNVLVTPAGRVAILDFGLITEFGRNVQAQGRDQSNISSDAVGLITSEPALAQTDRGLVVGTIRYMAPEQACGLPLTRAADWYSFGVMMYEALVGESPFAGTASAILNQKRGSRVIAPDVRRHGIPTELSSLCVKLLDSEPAQRPSYAEILTVLRHGTVTSTPAPAADPFPIEPPFVGRERELSHLGDAFRAVCAGGPVVVLVHGRSGSGKSCLIERFLDQERALEGAIIVKGRCFEQESVPFKAVDSLIDALCRHLMNQPVRVVSRLLPRDIGTLSRMFPVLERVASIAAQAVIQALPPDPLELRRRAFRALCELLARLGDTAPLVLWIDDLQWGDLDSAELLSELLRAPKPPRLLLIASYRGEYERENPCTAALAASESVLTGDVTVTRIEVGPLADADAERLAAILVDNTGATACEAREQTASIAREAAGNPYLIAEIARHLQQSAGPLETATGPERGISVEHMLWARIERLPREHRRLLEVVAVAGQPLSQKSAYAASRLDIKDQAALVQLRHERLLRGTGPGIDDDVDVYHDQIRVALLNRLTEEARGNHHRLLAAELEAHGRTDPETLARHFAGGDQPTRAGAYYRAAAHQASQAMAFDRAAGLFRRALELGSWPFPEQGRLKAELGDALSSSRRGREAGDVYLEAAAEVPLAESIELRRRAFQQLLTSGDHDLGIDVLRRVFQAVGLRYPETPGKALLSAALGLVRLRFRGLAVRSRPARAIDDDERLRLDVGWSGGLSLCLIDSARAAPIFIHNLNRALKAGDPLRATRALLAVSSLFAVRGQKSARRYGQFLHHAEQAMARCDDPNLLALHFMTRGLAAYAMGQWSLSRELNDQSAALFRDRCTGMMISLEMAAYYSLRSLCWLGDIAELRLRRQALIKEAEDRHDRFAVTNYRTEVMTYDLLAADDPAGAASEIDDAMSHWSRRGFHAQHLFALVANVRVDLYRGQGTRARQRIRDSWADYSRSQLHRSSIGRIMINQLIASSALASWPDHASRVTLDREASTAADRLEREQIGYATALARMFRARLAALRDDPATAIRLYRSASDQFHALEMPFFEAATQFRLGQLMPVGPGHSLVESARDCFESRLVKNPCAMIDMLLP